MYMRIVLSLNEFFSQCILGINSWLFFLVKVPKYLKEYPHTLISCLVSWSMTGVLKQHGPEIP